MQSPRDAALSPFEATLHDLTQTARQCETELQRFFQATQRVAERHASALEFDARKLIRDTNAKLHASSVAIARRHRRRRHARRRAPPPRGRQQPARVRRVLAAARVERKRCEGEGSEQRLASRPSPPAEADVRRPLADVQPCVVHEGRAERSAVHRESLQRDAPAEKAVRSVQGAQRKSSMCARRSSATVESYDTASAEILGARAVEQLPVARDRSRASGERTASHQANHEQVDRDAERSAVIAPDPVPQEEQPTDAHRSDSEEPAQSDHQRVAEESHQHLRSPQDEHEHETEAQSHEPAVREKLSAPLHPQNNRPSAASACSVENKNRSERHTQPEAEESEARPVEDEKSIADDHPGEAPDSTNSSLEKEPQEQQSHRSNHALPEPEESDPTDTRCSTESKPAGTTLRSEGSGTSLRDDPPARTQEEAVPAPSPQMQQDTAPSEAAEVDEIESAPSSVHKNPEEEASQSADGNASSLPIGCEPDKLGDESSPAQNRVSSDSVSQGSQRRNSEDVEKDPILTGTKASEDTQPKQITTKEAASVTEADPAPLEALPSSPRRQSSGGSKSSPNQKNDSRANDSMPAPKQLPPSRIPRKQSRIVVGNTGKIDHASLGVLSSIMSTKPLDKKDTQMKKSTEEVATPRTTRLFKPTNNIYSQQTGKPSATPQFSSSTRSSTLSHTPGAEAPLGRQSPAVSRQEKLANLNQQLEVFQSSNGAALQGPELQVAELRHGRKADPFVDDFNKPNDSRSAMEGDKVFRSVRERTLKFAETQRKDTSKLDLWLRGNDAKTTPARARMRAMERSKSKIAFRSELHEIMTGKPCSAEDHEREVSKDHSFGSGRLENSSDGDSRVEPKLSAKNEANLSLNRAEDGRKPSVDFGNGSLRSEKQNLRFTSGNSDTRNDFLSNLPTPSFSNGEKEVENMAESDVRVPNVQNDPAPSAPLANLMTSIASFIPGSSSLLGTRPKREESEETEAEASAKRQKLDMERREAELQARRDKERFLRQKEFEEKQRRAERRRLLLARAEKEREEERRRKEERRLKKKLEEEELRKKKKQEEDKKKEERRRLVLEKRAQNEMKLKRKNKRAEPQATRKAPAGPAGKAWMSGHGVPQTPDTDLSGCEKQRLSATPSTPVTKKTDASQGPSNYDMTPAQETVFELSDEEEERRKHKKIPQWAQGPKLSTAARAQPDPDNVFVNVPTCDLREVFGNVRRFRPRTSSANWTRDRVTAQEMLKFRKGQAAFNEQRQ